MNAGIIFYEKSEHGIVARMDAKDIIRWPNNDDVIYLGMNNMSKHLHGNWKVEKTFSIYDPSEVTFIIYITKAD